MFRRVQSKSNYSVITVQFKSKSKPLHVVALNHVKMLKNENVVKRHGNLCSYIYFMATVQKCQYK